MLLAAIAAYYRVPWSDEGWFSSAAFNLARHGFMGTTVLDPASTHLTRIDRRTYWVMPLYLLGQALWLKIFPATLFVIRLFTVAWIPLALFSFHRFLRAIETGANATALATCLFALSFIFVDNAGFARPDLMCCALGLAGLACYVQWRNTNISLALLSANAFVAASGLTHPNGIFYFLCLLSVVLFYDRTRLRFAALSAAVAPYLVLGALWSVYISRDPVAFLDQMRANGTNGRWTATLNPIAILWSELAERYAVAFGLATKGWALLKLPALLAYVAGIAGILSQRESRREPSTRLLLLLLTVCFFAMAIFNQKLTYYLIHILPWYIALLALFVVRLWERFARLRVVLAVATIALAGLDAGGILMKAYSRSQTAVQEQAAIEFTLAHARPRDRIAGTAALIYGFGFDNRLRDDVRLGIVSGVKPDIIVVEPVYQGVYDSWQTVDPATMRAVSERLFAYRLAFNNGCCRVYLPPQRRLSHDDVADKR